MLTALPFARTVLPLLVFATACGPTTGGTSPTPSAEPAAQPTPKPPDDQAPPGEAQPAPTEAETMPPTNTDAGAIEAIRLSGDTAVQVPGTTLTARMTETFHKTRAPLIGMSVLVELDGEPVQRAQVGWRVESMKIDHAWLELAGQRWDDTSKAYVDERIPGWLVRLDSIDAQSAGGSPTAITVSFKRAP